MAIDGSRCIGGSLEEQAQRYYWTVSDKKREEGKKRKEGNCGQLQILELIKSGWTVMLFTETRETGRGRGWCRHQDSLLPYSF